MLGLLHLFLTQAAPGEMLLYLRVSVDDVVIQGCVNILDISKYFEIIITDLLTYQLLLQCKSI